MLVVNNFGVKYVGEQYANHLLTVLHTFYVVDKNEKGDKYCGITINWNYDKQKGHFPCQGAVQKP